MKRFGRYDNDFNNLFECYSQVQPELVQEISLPSLSRSKQTKSTQPSYPGLNTIKIFVQQPGRGADLRHMASDCDVMSDDGDGGVILSGKSDQDSIHATITKNDAQIKIVDPVDGHVENEFVTKIKPRYDSAQNELSIIHVEEL